MPDVTQTPNWLLYVASHCDWPGPLAPDPPHVVNMAGPDPQNPETQARPLAHTLPQAPQLFGSDCSLTQAPPQADSPVGHWQVPLLHDPPVGQTFPHVPQFSCSLTHAPPQGTSPAGHWHDPLAQVAPVAHTLLQFPQLLLSVAQFTHVVPHAIWELEHDVTSAEHVVPSPVYPLLH
jgi:hypothetical protein